MTMAQRSTAARPQRKPRSQNPEKGGRTTQAPLISGVPPMVEQRTPSGSQRQRNPSMSISPRAGGREKKRAEIRIEGGAQVLIPAGMVGILKGGVIEVGVGVVEVGVGVIEVGVGISPIGIKIVGSPGSGSPTTSVIVDIIEVCAS